jgi:hypothetical protein
MSSNPAPTAPFPAGCFPQHLARVTVGENQLPLGEQWRFEK